jgi:hypothetical protein
MACVPEDLGAPDSNRPNRREDAYKRELKKTSLQTRWSFQKSPHVVQSTQIVPFCEAISLLDGTALHLS